jgi:hypothetical protein
MVTHTGPLERWSTFQSGVVLSVFYMMLLFHRSCMCFPLEDPYLGHLKLERNAKQESASSLACRFVHEKHHNHPSHNMPTT